MIKIDKVRLFVTPKRMCKGEKGCQGTCPIALAALDQMGFKAVSVGATKIVGIGGPLKAAVLTPVSSKHEGFITDFDNGRLKPGRHNFTYKVSTMPYRDALFHIRNAKLSDDIEREDVKKFGRSLTIGG
jgi:hypothetical protein